MFAGVVNKRRCVCFDSRIITFDYMMGNFLIRRRLRPIAVAVAVAVAFGAAGDVPAGYYSSLTGKREAELKNALHTLLYNHTEVSSYTALPDYFRKTDVYPRTDSRYGQWWEMYSDIPLYVNTFWGLNREHSFPKSWWGGSENTPAYVDLNHLYPSEKEANMAKSNYPLGEVQNASFDNGVSRVGTPVAGQGGGARAVFEPADEYKGDFARTYFYMVCCYQNLHWRYTYMVNNNTYPTLNPWSIDLLMRWHRDDPPSQKEISRNEEVYKVQANRNPFIDFKDLAEYLWGNRKGQPFNPGSSSEPAGEPVLITPVQDMALDFGQVAVGRQGEASLQFRGENIRYNVQLTVTGADAAMFTPEATQVIPAAINAPEGVWIKVKYNPASLGQHSARLIVSDYKDGGSRGIALRGECLEKPVLHDFRALAATDVTATSYTANWEIPAQGAQEDVVDYYVVTRTIVTPGGDPRQVDHVAEYNSLEIDDHAAGDAESYHVRSCRLGFYSAPTNEITVDFSTGLGDVVSGMPLGAVYEPGGIRIVCGGDHSGLRVYDVWGRVALERQSVTNGEVILLPQGVYILVTQQHPQPLKVVVCD